MAAHLACNSNPTKTRCFVGKSEHFVKNMSAHDMGSWVGGIFDRGTFVCFLHVLTINF